MVTRRAEFSLSPVSFVQMIWAAELLKVQNNNKQSDVDPHAHSYW